VSAGDVTQGRRVHDLEPHEYEPGDYGWWERGGAWYARCPGDGPRRLSGNLSNHQVVEHDDRTITVSPSILVTARWASVEQTWHGFLERGVWREV
jgi:hypothetical protein